MSQKSESTGTGSTQNEELESSSYEDTPRESRGYESTLPFGDHSLANNTTSYIIYKVNNANASSSTSSEDQEGSELKMEYFQRLNIIREKLASIDIANKSYYSKCFSYPPPMSQCKITEIFEDNNNFSNNVNDVDNNNINKPSASNTNEISYCKTDDAADNVAGDVKPIIKEDIEEHDSDDDFVENKFGNAISSDCSDLKSKTFLNLDVLKEETSLTENEREKPSEIEIKTIFDYGISHYNTESSIELLDLNYNPPKKRHCVRESTPKITKSEEGTESLPYRVRIGLHKDVPDYKEQEEVKKKSIENIHTIPRLDAGDYKKEEHGFAEAPAEDAQRSPTDSTDKDNLYVLFLDTLEQSQSGSPRSHKTVLTDTTETIESPVPMTKKRRLLLRSARNKVKPIDKITLWEEIRTMEAINRRKQGSSSSKESYFQKVILNNNPESDRKIDAASVGSLDIPRKASITTRFPSITKITKFCSFGSNKKSQTTVKAESSAEIPSVTLSEQNNTNNEQNNHKCHHHNIPSVANELLNVRKDQDIYFENDQATPTDEEHSEYSDPEEDDIDAYYQTDCLFCFCF